jgi:hypothetical protein
MKHIIRIATVLCVAICSSTSQAFAAGPDSTFSMLYNDPQISGTIPTVLLSSTVTTLSSRTFLAVADGRYFPVVYNGIAVVTIRIDGSETFSSKARTDFRTSNPMQRSFNALALVTLPAGTHSFQLIAYSDPSTPTGQFVVGSLSGLSVMTDPAPNSQVSSLTADSGDISTSTCSIPMSDGNSVPTTTLLTNGVNSFGVPVLSLGSGSAYFTQGQGDAAWRIYLNDQPLPNTQATWAANDLMLAAERAAPMSVQAVTTSSGYANIGLKATELALGCSPENAVIYKASAGTRLVSLWGMNLMGSGSYFNTRADSWQADWAAVSEVPTVTVTIPQGHNGVVLFMAKVRVQADSTDLGGNVVLRLNLDGVDVGTAAVQELRYPNSESTRTLSVSYLAAGAQNLSPGAHTMTLHPVVNGSFAHLALTKDMPLVYID